MLWTFCRGAARLYYEIRRSPLGAGYELVLVYPDGREQCENFEDQSALDRRALEVQQMLTNGGWFIASDPRR